ncbi:hypothetical protein BMS3Abin17_01045 [archaeon BMS3Abin17]|nr:hypothetical protein BMS3Abin17_01045 [archaeon BMS3Abin17]HDZ60729.1 hypothetical protein [Candidatus Pacearchaeota archaeon]
MDLNYSDLRKSSEGAFCIGGECPVEGFGEDKCWHKEFKYYGEPVREGGPCWHPEVLLKNLEEGVLSPFFNGFMPW